jgi:hypothetical protein
MISGASNRQSKRASRNMDHPLRLEVNLPGWKAGRRKVLKFQC